MGVAARELGVWDLGNPQKVCPVTNNASFPKNVGSTPCNEIGTLYFTFGPPWDLFPRTYKPVVEFSFNFINNV